MVFFIPVYSTLSTLAQLAFRASPWHLCVSFFSARTESSREPKQCLLLSLNMEQRSTDATKHTPTDTVSHEQTACGLRSLKLVHVQESEMCLLRSEWIKEEEKLRTY